jgi:hypothetical protein
MSNHTTISITNEVNLVVDRIAKDIGISKAQTICLAVGLLDLVRSKLTVEDIVGLIKKSSNRIVANGTLSRTEDNKYQFDIMLYVEGDGLSNVKADAVEVVVFGEELEVHVNGAYTDSLNAGDTFMFFAGSTGERELSFFNHRQLWGFQFRLSGKINTDTITRKFSMEIPLGFWDEPILEMLEHKDGALSKDISVKLSKLLEVV